MKKPIFAIKDAKSGYIQFYDDVNAGVAIRNFGQGCQNTESPLNKFPEDYSMYQIGEWDTDTGELTSIAPFCLAKAETYVNHTSPSSSAAEN